MLYLYEMLTLYTSFHINEKYSSTRFDAYTNLKVHEDTSSLCQVTLPTTNPGVQLTYPHLSPEAET